MKLTIQVVTLRSIFFLLITACIVFLGFCLETDTLSPGLLIKDPETIVSRDQIFKLGFFTPKNSTKRYLAVLDNTSESDQTVIWVANRDNPLNDSSGIAKISEDGNLVLTNAQNRTVWSTNATTSPPRNTSAQILDTGNLVLRDDNAAIWDSFSYPSNYYMPTMRLSENINTGKKVVLSSWRNESDPAAGSFTAGIKALDIPQSFIWNNGRPHWRSGPWNGRIFLGYPYMGVIIITNDSAGTFYFTIPEWKIRTKLELTSSGNNVVTVWDDGEKSWQTLWFAPETQCDVYGTCGPFGSCNTQDSPICSCLRGFEPANAEEWGRGNWTSGCQRTNQLQCHQNNGSRDGFSRMQFIKVPDFAETFPAATRKEECGNLCLRNCSCIAYAHDPNIGCMFWTSTLIDMQRLAGAGVDLYVRLSASDLDNHGNKKLFIIVPVVVAVVLIILIAWYWMVKRKREKTNVNKINLKAGLRTSSSDSTAITLKDESKVLNIKELPLFKSKMIAEATDQFHDNNLLGQGGFGSVYKGKLANGTEIAVKRLASSSGQGMEEFMNEVILICKLQHRNLVRLLGCCVEKEEKMLVYEYMPNKSLDVHLFHSTVPSTKVLDWKKRFSIIEGIGRGLLYLHRDSRLRIVHRDLKPSNVLLDEEWNPKISDFGMARIFCGNKDHGSTARIVGTYGYMSPEYATEGKFSEKSDVYSFGVMMVEIIKGQKNTRYYNDELSLSLLGCAWKFWSEGNGLAFADETIANSNFQKEIIRCIHIALLCVQEFPNDRPSIQAVLSMLSCEILDLPTPKQPVFAEKWNESQTGTTGRLASQDGYSINELSHTVLDGR